MNGYAQNPFWSDTFEDAGAPSSGTRNVASAFTTSADRLFNRTNAAGVSIVGAAVVGTSYVYSGIEGTKFWAGEDTDNGATVTTANVLKTITWTINISGKSNIKLKGLFAAGNTTGGGYENGSASSTGVNDYMSMQYSIDGGSIQNLLSFYPLANAATNLFPDNNFDGNGDPATTALNNTFTEFTGNVAGTGSTLTLYMNMSMTGSAEEVAIDNLRLIEVPSTVAPTVSTAAATQIGGSQATLGGNVTVNGGDPVIARGIVWATTSNPTLSNNVSANGSGDGIFSGTVAGFPPSTLIHYRAYATNGIGTSYGADLTFTTAAALGTSATSQTNIACNGATNGSASVTASGGSGGYTYSWSPTGGTGSTATGLAAGSYTLTITDNVGESIIRNFSIIQPATALAVTPASQTNIACFGGSNGSASVNTPTGGTPGYTYNWAPGNPAGDGTASVTGLTAGTYTVTVTDANGCAATQSFTITQPVSALAVTPSSQTNIACFGGASGSATVNTPTGGTPGYTYNWTPGNPAGDGTASVTGLTAGTYTVTVTDANGCTATQSFTITQPVSALAVTPSSQTNIACFGEASGSATVNTPTGGTPGYTYNWTPGNPTGDGTASVTGLSAGTYTVTVTDANGCSATQSFTITQPASALSTATGGGQTNVSCNGGTNGTASVSPSGGTPGYTYSWSPAGGTSATASGLSAGTYTVTVTDANGCTATRTYTITQPNVISTATGSQTNVSCNGGTNGTASVSPSGGTPGYTYSWSPAGGTAATASGLAAGTYTVMVTDANGCTATRTYTITEPAALISTATLAGGTITADQAGGSYQWIQCPATILVGENGQSYTPTTIGSYAVVITIGSCSTISSCILVNTLANPNFEEKAKFIMYPNPSKGIVSIESDHDSDLNITNQLGQTIKTAKVSSDTINTINIESFADGIYFITEKKGSKLVTHKLILKK